MRGFTVRQRVQAVLRGRPDLAALPLPLLSPSERAVIARTAFQRAGTSYNDDPLDLADGLGVSVCFGSTGACGAELYGDGVVLVRWTLRRRERSLLVLHGLAHALLADYSPDHNETDVWLLAVELAAPERERRADPVAMRELSPAPNWLFDCLCAGELAESLAATGS